MLATQLNTVKVHGLTVNLSLEDQISNFMEQFQLHIEELTSFIDISNEETIRWGPATKKAIITQKDFTFATEVDNSVENIDLAMAKIFQSGFLELCDVVYYMSSRG